MTWRECMRGFAHRLCLLQAHQPLAAGLWSTVHSDQSTASVFALFLSPRWPSHLPPGPHRPSELFHPQIPNSRTPGSESPTLPSASHLLCPPRSSSSWKDPCPPDPSALLCPQAPLSCPTPFWADPQEGAGWRRALGPGGSQPAPPGREELREHQPASRCRLSDHIQPGTAGRASLNAVHTASTVRAQRGGKSVEGVLGVKRAAPVPVSSPPRAQERACSGPPFPRLPPSLVQAASTPPAL